MSGRFWRWVATGCICVMAAPAVAHAQSTNQVAAEALFREARKLLESGRYHEACEKLAASNRLDPAAGTLLNLARCREKIGQTATAWATYHEAVSVAKAAGQTEREKAARESAAALEPLLPRLTIVVSPDARAVNPQIRRDGMVVPPDLWGATVPVDPGEHLIEANAPGRQRWAVKTSIEARATAIITVPTLEQSPTAATPQPPYAAPSKSIASPATTGRSTMPSANTREGEAADGGSGWSGAKTGSLIVAGIGVAGLVVGGIELARFQDKKREANDVCPGGACYEPEHSAAVSLLDEAHNARTIGIVAGSVGGVALVGAAILWFTAPSGSTGAKRVTLLPSTTGRDVGLSLGGAW